MSSLQTSFLLLLLGTAAMTVAAWRVSRLVRVVDTLAQPHDDARLNAEDVRLASAELNARSR
jgi:hypothetical protein